MTKATCGVEKVNVVLATVYKDGRDTKLVPVEICPVHQRIEFEESAFLPRDVISYQLVVASTDIPGTRECVHPFI